MNSQLPNLSEISGMRRAPVADMSALQPLDGFTLEILADCKAFFANQGGVSHRGPGVTAIQVGHFIELASRQGVGIDGKRVIDFGCGEARPFGVMLFFYLCGAARTLSVDLEEMLDQASVSVQTAMTVVSILLGLAPFDPVRFGVDGHLLAQRAAGFDLRKLMAGYLFDGLPSQMRLKQCRYQNLPPDQKSFDIMVSNSVWEHVLDLEDCLAEFRRNIAPDGVIFTAIDYKDHRVYGGTATSWWEYMIDGAEEASINRIRHRDMCRLIASAGFRIADCELEILAPLPEELDRFLPRYRKMDEDDLKTTGARLLLRPI